MLVADHVRWLGYRVELSDGNPDGVIDSEAEIETRVLWSILLDVQRVRRDLRYYDEPFEHDLTSPAYRLTRGSAMTQFAFVCRPRP